jgi:phosphoribosylanthranilate isomerase
MSSEGSDMSIKMKICGITRVEDAYTAIEAGADYLGFIMYERSPRYTGAVVAKTITDQLRSTTKCPLLVAVFVNEPAELMADILDSCGLDLAQLSGEEPADVLTALSSPLYGRCYKGIRPTSLQEAAIDVERYHPPSSLEDQPDILVDAYHPTLRGGIGEKADWQIAAILAQNTPRLMLAGGLDSSNVAQAIEQVRPYAVDVASGVEESPGIKSASKIRAFATAVQESL